MSHYQQGPVEAIDVMKSISTTEEYRGFLRLNTLKYIWRCNDKHERPIEDLKKARYYLQRLIMSWSESKSTFPSK
jgi:hypothetical protein